MNEQHDPADPIDATDVKLDGLLQTWADEVSADDVSADPSGNDRLLRAILTAVPHASHALQTPNRQPEFASSGVTPLRVVPVRGAWSALVACVALMVLLAVSMAIPVSPRTSTPRSTPPTVARQSATGSRLTRATTVGQKHVAVPDGLTDLWNRTADLFGPHLNWLCDLDGELLLGVDPGTATVAEHDRAYVLLTVRVRNAESDQWSSVWTGRVVCPLGESVDFDSNKTHSGGTIWVQSRPNGRVVASHWLNWPDHPEISGSVDIEVAPGESRVVAERIADGRSIQLLQQVWTPHAG